VPLYEKNYANAPAGKTFQECYDVKTITPTDEYVQVYDGARKKLEGLGLVILSLLRLYLRYLTSEFFAGKIFLKNQSEIIIKTSYD